MTGYARPSLWDNPDATERLKVHHAAGLSCSQIARALNTEFRGEPFVSRNGVIGKLARLGLTHRADPRPADPTIALAPRHWETRRFSECAFPVGGEGAGTLSCCNPTRGETYCTDHRRAMYSGGSSARGNEVGSRDGLFANVEAIG